MTSMPVGGCKRWGRSASRRRQWFGITVEAYRNGDMLRAAGHVGY
jgi:hypothetical protein